MRKIFLSILIALFGVVALPASPVFANGVDGGVEEPVYPSDNAYDKTKDALNREMAEAHYWCLGQGIDEDDCNSHTALGGAYYAEYREWLAHEYAYANGEAGVQRVPKPVRAEIFPRPPC